jgi:hypothetical protein
MRDYVLLNERLQWLLGVGRVAASGRLVAVMFVDATGPRIALARQATSPSARAKHAARVSTSVEKS